MAKRRKFDEKFKKEMNELAYEIRNDKEKAEYLISQLRERFGDLAETLEEEEGAFEYNTGRTIPNNKKRSEIIKKIYQYFGKILKEIQKLP